MVDRYSIDVRGHLQHSLTPSWRAGCELNHATLLQSCRHFDIFGLPLTRLEGNNMGLEALIVVPIVLFAVFALIIHGGW